MDDLLSSFPRSNRELEKELALDRAFTMMRRDPRLTEIDFGANAISSPTDFEQLWRISNRHGVDVEIEPTGRVNVRRPAPEPELEPITALLGRAIVSIWHDVERVSGLERVRSCARSPRWNAGFDGLTEGVR